MCPCVKFVMGDVELTHHYNYHGYAKHTYSDILFVTREPAF